MLTVRNRYLIFSLWALLFVSMIFWVVSVTAGNISRLSFIPPFQRLGSSFWIGLIIVLVIFFTGNYQQKIVSLVVICAYMVMTLPLIFDLPAMHDSLLNTTALPAAQGQFSLYGKTYPGMRLVLNTLFLIFGRNPWTIAHYFPVGVALLYLLILWFFCYNWREIIFSSFTSEILFIFFIFVFGESFYLRTNASPQTLGYLFFLFSISLIPPAKKSNLAKAFLFISLIMMIVSHPISPIFSLPGFFAAVYIRDEGEKKHLLHAVEFVLLIAFGYALWTIYKGGWVIRSAFHFLLNSLQVDKISSGIDHSSSFPMFDSYLITNRFLLISLLVVLAVFFVFSLKTKAWRFASIWGFGLLPVFILLFNQQDFFDRVFLFGLVPSALIFAEGSQRLLSRFRRLRLVLPPIFISLALISSSVSYFYIGSVDRVTYDEVLANHYLETLGRDLVVYANGFNLPSEQRIIYLPDTRGILDPEKASTADAVILSRQSINASLINSRAVIKADDFENWLQDYFVLVKTFGSSHVYLKKALFNVLVAQYTGG